MCPSNASNAPRMFPCQWQLPKRSPSPISVRHKARSWLPISAFLFSNCLGLGIPFPRIVCRSRSLLPRSEICYATMIMRGPRSAVATSFPEPYLLTIRICMSLQWLKWLISCVSFQCVQCPGNKRRLPEVNNFELHHNEPATNKPSSAGLSGAPARKFHGSQWTPRPPSPISVRHKAKT